MDTEDLLSAYPPMRGDAEYTDADALVDLKEWAETAKAALGELDAKCAEAQRDRDFFRTQAEKRCTELRDNLKALEDVAELLRRLRIELVDRDAYVEALEVEVSELEKSSKSPTRSGEMKSSTRKRAHS